MPTIFVNGPITKSVEQRREIVQGITKVIVEAYDLPPQSVTVVIREDESDRVGISGVLISER